MGTPTHVLNINDDYHNIRYADFSALTCGASVCSVSRCMCLRLRVLLTYATFPCVFACVSYVFTQKAPHVRMCVISPPPDRVAMLGCRPPDNVHDTEKSQRINHNTYSSHSGGGAPPTRLNYEPQLHQT